MSGIVGIYYLDGRTVEREVVTRMTDAIAHRGSDAANIWVNGSVGFGHRMLWTTPESLFEQLPLISDNGELVLTADARIDNRTELIALLEWHDRPLEKIADSEFILGAYQKWGEECVDHLIGDFAFAIWDQSNQTLFCARDHFGVKPFYYYYFDNFFIFASEIKALFCLPEVPHEVDAMSIAEYLAIEHWQTENTFFKQIVRLLPAHHITLSPRIVKSQPYWRLNPTYQLTFKSNAEYTESFLRLFSEAVQCRMRSAFPIGSMLSGGLDSSSITCVARNLLKASVNQPLHTFSAIFDQIQECDESIYQNAVIAQGNIIPHYINADQISPLEDCEQIFWHNDEVYSGGNLRTNWNAYKLAQQANVRVILDGFDGDSTVSHGLGYLAELAQSDRWIALASVIHAYSTRLGQPWWPAYKSWLWVYRINPFLRKFSILKRLIHLVKHCWRGAKHLLGKHPHRASVQPQPLTAKTLLNPSFIARLGLDIHLNSRSGQARTERENHCQRLTGIGMSQALELLDKVSLAHDVEVRFPFWDKRLIEYCVSLPPSQKIFQGWTRMVMRRAMAGILPDLIQWRVDKTDMHPGFEQTLLNYEQVRLEELIIHQSSSLAEYVNLSALREAYDRFKLRTANDQETNLIWRAVTLGLWLQQEGFEEPSFSGNHSREEYISKERW